MRVGAKVQFRAKGETDTREFLMIGGSLASLTKAAREEILRRKGEPTTMHFAKTWVRRR